MNTLDIGPGKQWRTMLLSFKIIFGVVAVVFLGTAVTTSGSAVGLLIAAAVFAALAFALPWLMSRQEPHILLTAEGITGPNLPTEVAWQDIRDAEVRLIPARGRVPAHDYVMLDVPDVEAYLSRLSKTRRALLQANKLYGLRPLSIRVTDLSRTPDEIAALVRERAAYAAPEVRAAA